MKTFITIVGLLIVVTVVVLVGVAYLGQQSDQGQNIYDPQPQIIKQEDITWYQPADRSYNLVVLKNHDIEINFTTNNAQSLKEQARSQRWLLAVNGGYFRGSIVDAEPIGILQITGQKINKKVKDSQNQITHAVIIDHQKQTLRIQSVQSLDESQYATKRYSIFQTGPNVVAKNNIDQAAINAAPNGKGRYLRALIGNTERGEIIIVLGRVAFTLTEIAERVLDTEILHNRTISLVNLDGGSSTAMFSAELDQFNFGENKKIPAVIGIRP